MRQRRALILVAVALFLAALLSLTLFREAEPRYHGTPLSTWLTRYQEARLKDDVSGAVEAESAIKAIGTNALPCLLKWLPYRESRQHKLWVNALRSMPPVITGNRVGDWLASDKKQTRSLAAMFGFQALGTNATAAIPELARLMNLTDPKDDDTTRSAIYALASLGDASIPSLATGLTNTLPSRRVLIVKSLGDPRFAGQNRAARVLILVKCLQDENSFVVREAALSLGRLGTDSDLVIPALEKAINKPRADVAPEVIQVLNQFRATNSPR